GEQEKNPSQSFLAGIEKLIYQVLFVADVSRQQIPYEQIRKRVSPVQRSDDRLLVEFQKSAIGDRGCRTHAQRLACQATFTEKIAGIQDGDRGFLAAVRYDAQFHLACLNVKNRTGLIPLSEDCLFQGNLCVTSCARNRSRGGAGISSG